MTAMEQLIAAARRALNDMNESCYDPASMEYGPGYPCPRHQLIEALAEIDKQEAA